jgi:EmrB/QacA subfamily drug resistance transporter
MTRQQTNPWAALSALCIGFFMIMLDTTIVSVAIPAMGRGLNASLNSVVWVTSVYLLTYAVPLLVTGRLGDRIGRKPMFLAGMIVFTAASAWCGLAGSIEVLIIARAVQGLGAAMMTPQTMAFISVLFPPERRGAPMGAWGAVAGVATIAGPLLGGVLVDWKGWQLIFWVNVPIGLIGIVLTVLLVPGGQQRTRRGFDLLGTALSGLGLLAVVYGVQNGQQYHWGKVWGPVTAPEIIGLGVLLLIGFVLWQRFTPTDPLIPLSLFGNRNFSAANLANVTIGFTMTGMFLPLVIFVQSVLGFSPLMSGLVTAPMSLISGVVAPVAGRLSDRISGKWVALTGFVLLAVGIAIIAAQLHAGMNAWTLVPAFLVVGAGVGCVFSPLANLAMSSVAPRQMGAASGVFNTFRQVGGVLGSAAIGVLLQARVASTLPAAAREQARSLPPAFRAEFVGALSRTAGSASEFGTAAPPLPAGIPTAVAGRIAQLGTTAFHDGFATAAQQTLLLPAGVMVLGVLACLAMTARTNRREATPQQPQDIPAPPAVPQPVE